MNNINNNKRIIYQVSSTEMSETGEVLDLSSWINFLRSNSVLVKELISSSPNSIFWQSPDGEFLSCSRSMAAVLGFSEPKEIVGKKHDDIFASDIVKKIKEHDKIAIDSKSVVHIEEHVFDSIGNNNIYLTSKIPFYDNSNNFLGLVGLVKNITFEKTIKDLQNEIEMMKSNMEQLILQEKLSLTEKVANIVASEIRNPLASLNLILDLIVDNDANRNHEMRSCRLEQIISNGKKTIKDLKLFMESMLFKFRNFNKRLTEDDLFPCNILENIQYVLDTFPFVDNERQLISFHRQNDFIYKGDPLHTKNILTVLLKNALQAIDKESNETIEISFDKDKKFNKLIIYDTGKGISPKVLPNIFDALVAKDSTGMSSGFGLAFCKWVMLDYGGDITCESVLGEYTKFTCFFPRIK